jgi:HTH-type transcriptional regulator/antitoxin HigA
VEKMNAVAAVGYGDLLSEMQPEVVRSEEQNQRYIQWLEELIGQKVISPAQDKLIALLTLLVEDYEDKRHPLPEAGPLDVIRHLMEANHLRQRTWQMFLERKALCRTF